MLPSEGTTSSALTMSDISGLHHAAHKPAVYASRPASPQSAQDSLPIGRPTLVAQDFHPQDLFRRFRLVLSISNHDFASSRLVLAHSSLAACTGVRGSRKVMTRLDRVIDQS